MTSKIHVWHGWA